MYLAGPPFADEYRRRAEAFVRRAGWKPIDPMRRDYRGRTEGNEAAIVEGCEELELAVEALSVEEASG